MRERPLREQVHDDPDLLDSDKHSLEPRTSYRKSGWTMFEMFISMMVKHSDMVIDLPRALEWIRKIA